MDQMELNQTDYCDVGGDITISWIWDGIWLSNYKVRAVFSNCWNVLGFEIAQINSIVRGQWQRIK